METNWNFLDRIVLCQNWLRSLKIQSGVLWEDFNLLYRGGTVGGQGPDGKWFLGRLFTHWKQKTLYTAKREKRKQRETNSLLGLKTTGKWAYYRKWSSSSDLSTIMCSVIHALKELFWQGTSQSAWCSATVYRKRFWRCIVVCTAVQRRNKLNLQWTDRDERHESCSEKVG